ncbi:alkaline phosphatase family protein [soil metagenome]
MPRTALIIAVLFLAVLLAVLTPMRSPAVVELSPKDVAVPRVIVEPDPSVIVGPPKVKLAVFIVFDQMRGDYIAKWKPYFPPGGFNRLMDDGAWFSDCKYAYATTTTGPGHAALLSGTTQNFTGIINNEWYDRDQGIQVYCAGSDRYEIVSGTNVIPKKTRVDTSGKKPKVAGTPDRMLSPNVADQLKASDRGGKVFGVSLKDRSAIFPAGHAADGAYWFTSEFITSTYYRDSLPPWVREFNNSKVTKQWFGKNWDRYRKDLDYAKIAGPDKGPGEANRGGLGITFPHPVTGGKSTFTNAYYEALITSPYGNDLLLEFAKACITAEKLGQRGVTDMITISFSSNDLVGHAYGPDSQEVFDVTLRSDNQIKQLLDFLDAKIGKDQYCVVVSADHGICPLPEASQAKGIDAKRVITATMFANAEFHLRTAYGKPLGADKMPSMEETIRGNFTSWIEANPVPWVYLNHRQMEARGLDAGQVTENLATYLRGLPDVARVYTRQQLDGDMANGDQIDRLVKDSYHPVRSGDLYVMLKPYYLFSSPLQGGTTHGTPYDYDRWVPLVVYGPGVIPGEKGEHAVPQQAAAIMSEFLGVKPPRDAQFELPATLFKK